MEIREKIRKTVRRFQDEVLQDEQYAETVIDHGDQGYASKPKADAPLACNQPTRRTTAALPRQVLVADFEMAS